MNWENAIMELMELVKSAAPALWGIARRQVYAEVAQFGVWVAVSIGMAVAFLVLSGIARRRYKEARREWKDAGGYYSDRPDGDWRWASLICGLALIVASLVLCSHIISRLINPDYYAIKVLINLVKLGG